MSLTKKDFEAIAVILKQFETQNKEELVLMFSNYFKTQNALFDENRFKEAVFKDLK